jgi:hypothetical protein
MSLISLNDISYSVITLSDFHCTEIRIRRGLGIDELDPINQIISLSVITLCGFRCTNADYLIKSVLGINE